MILLKMLCRFLNTRPWHHWLAMADFTIHWHIENTFIIEMNTVIHVS